METTARAAGAPSRAIPIPIQDTWAEHRAVSMKPGQLLLPCLTPAWPMISVQEETEAIRHLILRPAVQHAIHTTAVLQAAGRHPQAAGKEDITLREPLLTVAQWATGIILPEVLIREDHGEDIPAAATVVEAFPVAAAPVEGSLEEAGGEDFPAVVREEDSPAAVPGEVLREEAEGNNP